MNQRIINVNVAYNGMRPRVSVSINWKQYFAALWQCIKDGFHAVINAMKETWRWRNALTMYAYTYIVVLLIGLMLAYGIEAAQTSSDVNACVESLLQSWDNFLALHGIVHPLHQIGMTILVMSAFCVIITPAGTWAEFNLRMRFGESMTNKERGQILVKRADEMIAKFRNYTFGICLGIIGIAIATGTIWWTWTMLQMH